MRILVTGHLGYIGTILVPSLLDAGHDVVGLDSDLYRACTFGDPAAIRAVPQLEKDLRDVVPEDLDGFDALIHLAALSNDPLGDLDPQLTYEINHRASVRLASLARDAGVRRFIFSSSCSNYGASGGMLLDEDAELRPVTPYGQSKVLVEHDVGRLATDSFVPVFLRNATAYGVSPRFRFDIVLNNLVAWGCVSGQVVLKSDGTPWRPIVHVEDIARAFRLVLDAPPELIRREAFNVGATSENYQIRDLARIAAEVLPGTTIQIADGASPDTRNYRVDCEKISRTLGFEPQWDARRGAIEIRDVCVRLGATVADFEGPLYLRVARIKELRARGVIGPDLRFVDRSGLGAAVA